MRVHDDTDIDAECIAQNDIRRFASNAVELRQFLHRLRNLSAMALDEFAAAVLDVLRLVAKKAGRFNGLLQLGERGVRVVRHRAIFFEQLFRDNIDAFIGALCRKNRGDEQFQRLGVIQLTARFRISPVQRGDDFPQSCGSGFGCFAWHLR